MKKRVMALCIFFTMLVAMIPRAAMAASYTVSDGQTFNIGTSCADGDTVNVEAGATATITGSKNVRISCGAGVTLTLDSVNIDCSGLAYTPRAVMFSGAGNILISKGTNTLKSGDQQSGIIVESGTALEIKGYDDTAALNVTGGTAAAGIGARHGYDAGIILISSGTVTATGGGAGAGIGGKDGHGGTVRITGGEVTATGGGGGAGIGTGSEGTSGNITITGGTVTARGEDRGAGIGGGNHADGGDITITGGTVVAYGGQWGAGIGGGTGGGGGNITITGGAVFARYGPIGQHDIGAGNSGSGGTCHVGQPYIFLTHNAHLPFDGPLSYMGHISAVDGKIYGCDVPSGWSPVHTYAYTVQITYHPNGGTGNGSTILPAGTSTNIANDTGFSRSGYTFVEWNTQPDGGGTSYSAGQAYTMSGDITLYAIWQAIDVTGVDITDNVVILSPDGIAALTADVTPSGAADKTLDWTSSDESVATVNNRGVVTAVGTGSTVITAESSNSLSDTCQIAVSSVLLNYALSTGSVMNMTAAVDPSDNTATWTSDETSVATVDAYGKVTAKAPGLAMIKVAAGGVSQTVGVAVYDQTATSVKLSRTSVDMTVNDTIGLTAYVDPDDAVNKDVAWTSDDEDVVTVNDSGTVTAVGAGSTTITAKSGGQSAVCSVEVTQPVTSVSIGSSSKKLSLNETADLKATVSPGDATDADVTWTSSDESIVTVGASGTVKAEGFGSTTVIAEADGKYDTCTVSVVKTDVTGINLSSSAETLKKGATISLSTTVLPDGATYPDVTWTSSDESVATVDANGEVMAKDFGSATVTAEADGVTAVCTVSVVKTNVAGVTLSRTYKEMNAGDNITLKATVTPGGATYSRVTWTSTNMSVATVDASGTVTAVSPGAAAITAAADGQFAVCAVMVVSEADVQPSPMPTDSGDKDDAPDTGDESPEDTPAPKKVIITIVISDLPEGTKSVKLPGGEVVELDGSDTIQFEVDEEYINEDGAIELTALDDEGTPLGEYEAGRQEITIPDSGTAWDKIGPVLMWILIGIGGLGAAGIAVYLILRRRQAV